MSVRRIVSPDAASAAEACARHVVSVLDQVLAEREFASFAISGGSSPRAMFGILAAARLPWNRVHLFWVDERCVPPSDPASNYKMACESLIERAHIPAKNVHRVVGEAPPKAAAERYAGEIRSFFGLTDGDLPRFDVIHRGMGPDAHTASLFPGEPLIDDRQGIAGAVFVPKFSQWRVTLLPGVLLAANETVVLAAGADKAEAIRAVLNGPYDPKQYPAQLANQHGGVSWFLDEASAKLFA